MTQDVCYLPFNSFILCFLTVGSADGRPAKAARRCRVSEKTSRQAEDKGEGLCEYKMVKKKKKNLQGHYKYLTKEMANRNLHPPDTAKSMC